MEIRRFGPGHRRPEGPPGSQGLTGQVIHSDERGIVSEVAFSRRALIPPHSNPNLTLFIVVSGGGYVQVGGERTRVNHGEAVVWPPGVDHGAYTDGVEMRAIIVELPEPGAGMGYLEGTVTAKYDMAPEDDPGRDPGDHRPPERAQGALAERTRGRDEYDASEGEPW